MNVKSYYLVLIFFIINLCEAKGQVEFRVTIDLAVEFEKRQETSSEELIITICELTTNYENASEKSFCKKIARAIKKDPSSKVDIFSASDYWDSDKFKRYMRENDFSSAYINAYFNNERIDMKDVLEGNLGNEKQKVKSKNKWNRKRKVFKESGIVFRITIDVPTEMRNNSIDEIGLSEKLCEALKSYKSEKVNFQKLKCKKLRKSIVKFKNGEPFIIKQGYEDYWEIDKLKKFMRTEGFASCFLICYRDGTRVPIKDVLSNTYPSETSFY